MNYSITSSDFLDTFAEKYTPPYWMYTVTPRSCDQPLYYKHIDFGQPPYNELESHYILGNGDIIEFFILKNRLLVVGAEIEVIIPSDIVFRPVTRSGVPFDLFSCSGKCKATLTPFGGILDRSTDLAQHSFRVEEPDYFGLQVVSGADNLPDLEIAITLSVSDEFSLDARSNSTKDQ